MEENIKRSLIGYRPTDVKKYIALKNEEHLQKYSNYEKELTNLKEENVRLKNEVEALDKQMQEYKEIQKKIENILYNAHIDACTRTYETASRFEEMLEYKMTIIRNQHQKNEEIKTLISRLMKKVSSIVEESY